MGNCLSGKSFQENAECNASTKPMDSEEEIESLRPTKERSPTIQTEKETEPMDTETEVGTEAMGSTKDRNPTMEIEKEIEPMNTETVTKPAESKKVRNPTVEIEKETESMNTETVTEPLVWCNSSQKYVQRTPDWRRDGLHFVKRYEDLPDHVLNSPHLRISCHDDTRVIHGNRHKNDENAVIDKVNSTRVRELGLSLKVYPGKYGIAIRIKVNKYDFTSLWKFGDHANTHSMKPWTDTRKYLVAKNRVYTNMDMTKNTFYQDCIMYYQHGRKSHEKWKEIEGAGWQWMYFEDHVECIGRPEWVHKLEFELFMDQSYYSHGLTYDVIEIFKVDSLEIDQEEVLKKYEKCSVLPSDILRIILQMAPINDFVIE